MQLSAWKIMIFFMRVTHPHTKIRFFFFFTCEHSAHVVLFDVAHYGL